MKRYTGKLSEATQQILKNSKPIIAEALKQSLSGLGKPSNGVTTLEESIQKFNKNLTESEIKAWVWYKRNVLKVPMKGWEKWTTDNSKELDKWVKEGALFIVKDGFLPYPVFTYGNMYDRLLEVQSLEDEISKKFGQKVYQQHLKAIESNTPRKLSILDPVSTERPRILAISRFARDEFKVSSLREASNVILDEEATLQYAFTKWLYTLSDHDFKASKAFDIVEYYLYGGAKPRNIEKPEWQEIQKYSREEGEEKFTEFLHEMLELKDQQKIDVLWNRQYNAHAAINYDKVPFGVEVSKSFHGFEFMPREAQREGLAFMDLVGSGIIAYDVGVGKTITAIMELANAIQTGKAKRPLVVVPNPTYKNWIKEMLGYGSKAGLLTGTGIELNEWYNLGAKVKADISKKVKEGTITLMTYEGFMNLGFGDTIEQGLFWELSNILDQESTGSKRDAEKQNEKFREIIGVGQKGSIADIEVLGFDYICIDEAHNFKNVFGDVKKDNDDDKKRFHIKSGKPSDRGIKAFLICNYIQRTFGRNVMLLSATPFTNSPLEIYSMLSLVGYHYLKKNGNVQHWTFFRAIYQ